MVNVAQYRSEMEVKSYIVSESLADALITVDCESVGPWHLKGIQALHFIFRKGELTDKEGADYTEMFFTILPPGEQVGVHKNMDNENHKRSMFLIDPREAAPGQHHSIYIGSKYKQGTTLEDILQSASTELGSAIADELKVKALRLALNSVLYVHSSEPEIMALKPQLYNQRYFRDNYFSKPKMEQTLFGIFSLGWDFHGREYKVSMGLRKGRFKWQPCGKNWEQRKFIYVEQTTVNYGKQREDA